MLALALVAAAIGLDNFAVATGIRVAGVNRRARREVVTIAAGANSGCCSHRANFSFAAAANSQLSGHLLLGILNPEDELVASQRCDVPPSNEYRQVGDQLRAQVCRELVHYTTGNTLIAHTARLVIQRRCWFGPDSRLPTRPRSSVPSGRKDNERNLPLGLLLIIGVVGVL